MSNLQGIIQALSSGRIGGGRGSMAGAPGPQIPPSNASTGQNPMTMTPALRQALYGMGNGTQQGSQAGTLATGTPAPTGPSAGGMNLPNQQKAS